MWISILDQLPKDNEWKFICIANNCDDEMNVGIAHYSEDGERWTDNFGSSINPDYWMEIPRLEKK